jgi:hypothetical protein
MYLVIQSLKYIMYLVRILDIPDCGKHVNTGSAVHAIGKMLSLAVYSVFLP